MTVLDEIKKRSNDGSEFDPDGSFMSYYGDGHAYVSYTPGKPEICIDGGVTATDLELLVKYMRETENGKTV